VVVSGAKVLNQDGLRYSDEFVRHKVLDCVGDLYLAGGPIVGRFEGLRTGHRLNNQLLRALFADPSATTVVPMHAGLLGSIVPPARTAIAVGA
jgi:UDP-3-O-[3-hydroxymyristoyl] N-acetylglucosamine deacetylase